MGKQRKRPLDKRKLSGGEQQFKATIQQLRASEQQLKAANQQLEASNQQLRASEEELRAVNQQLRATEQQLRADIIERKRAEEMLWETRNYLEKLVNYANAPIIVLDPKFGITKFNRAFEQLTGHTTDEVIGQELSMLFPKASRKELRGKIEHSLSGEYLESLEIPILCKNGEIRLTLWNSANIYAEDDTTLLAIIAQCQDITERKRAQESLKAANQQLRASEQQLKAANQQLRASEQQLKAANQQLNASNQQLRASEEELRAVNQQLRATEQQLRADIIERKKVEGALRASERKFRTLIESSHEVIFSKDRDGYYRTLNLKAAIGLGGTCIEDIEGKTDYDLLPKEQADTLRKIDKQVMESGRHIEVEEIVRDAQGEDRIYLSHKWPACDDKGRITGVGCFAMDISKRKRAEEALKESEERFRNLMEYIPGVSIQGYGTDGTVFYWNRASEEIYGYTAEEAVGKNLGDLIIPPVLKPHFEKGLEVGAGTTKSGEFIPGGEYDLLRKDGTLVPVHSIHTAVCLEGKEPLMFCIDVDLSERKQVEKKLLDYQSQLKSLASQLTLAEEHERRLIATELHATIGQSLAVSKLQLDTLRASVPSADIAKTLGEVCESLDQAIQDTRSLTFDISSPILYELGFEAAVSEWLTEQIKKKYGIATEFEDDEQPKPLDDDICVFLFRDVRELLINVVKHAQAKKIKVSVRKVGRQIKVSVEDDGIGFDTNKVAATAVRAGGFGLFSIRERLEQLGGHLEIESEPGHGTTVTVAAPLKHKKNTNEGQE